MAYSVTLHLEGHPREQDGINVISCEFEFKQQTDTQGFPIGLVMGGAVDMILKNENDSELWNWLFIPKAKKNGKIVFSSGMTDNQSFQTIKFTDAILFGYRQTFSEESEIRVYLHFSCLKMDISGVTFENSWG
jgi:hypothetical protein